MSDIEKRLVASVKMDALNGNHAERDICGKQMLEAATELSRLKEELRMALSESVSERCSRTNVQCCSNCDDVKCGDNTNPKVKEAGR